MDESDHDEPAHDVRAPVDKPEVHDVLAAEPDAWSGQRAFPATRVVGGRAHAFVPRVALLDPFVRGGVLVCRYGRQGDGGGLGVLGGGDVEVGEGVGDPVGGGGGAAAALGGGFGGGVGGRGWGGRWVGGVARTFAGRGGRGGGGGDDGVRSGRDAERGVGGARGRRGWGHLSAVGCVDGFENAALHVAVEVGRDAEATTAGVTHER